MARKQHVRLATGPGMTWSRVGLVSCAVYAVAAGALQLVGLAFMDDPKGLHVLGQVSVLPGLYAMAGTGLAQRTLDLGWLNSIPAYFFISLIVVYVLGWGMQRVITARRGAVLAWAAGGLVLLFVALFVVPGLR